MNYHQAVSWFKHLGATPEPGPRKEEVTLIWRRPGGITQWQTIEIEDVIPMAEESRKAHMRNRLTGLAAKEVLQ